MVNFVILTCRQILKLNHSYTEDTCNLQHITTHLQAKHNNSTTELENTKPITIEEGPVTSIYLPT